jgi:hypothetical protein
MISAIMLDFQQDQKCGDVFFGGIEQHETAMLVENLKPKKVVRYKPFMQ